MLPRSTRANHCPRDQLNIANFLHVETRFRKALSWVLDYAYWRTKKANKILFVILYNQLIHPLCVRPVQTDDEALGIF